MKKYIEPTIELLELESEELMSETSPQFQNLDSGYSNQMISNDDDLAKKVNFADEESIW